MWKGRLTLIEACDRAAQIVTQTPEMDRLYHRAVEFIGEGELRVSILELATQALQDEELGEEVFVSDESMLSFLCGIWIQFLLTEVAGIRKEKLRTLAQKVFMDLQEGKSLH